MCDNSSGCGGGERVYRGSTATACPRGRQSKLVRWRDSIRIVIHAHGDATVADDTDDMANSDNVFTHFLVVRFACCDAVYVHNQYRVCNIGILVDECECRVDERTIRLYVACTIEPLAPRVHLQVMQSRQLLERDFLLPHTPRLCSVFERCYAHDSSSSSRQSSIVQQQRCHEWRYVISAADVDDDDDDSTAAGELIDYDNVGGSGCCYSDELSFGRKNDAHCAPEANINREGDDAATATIGDFGKNEDRLFLRDLLASVNVTKFYFNATTVIVRRTGDAATRQPLRFIIHSDVHNPRRYLQKLRNSWVLLLGDCDTRSTGHMALPRERQYRGPYDDEVFDYSVNYYNEYVRAKVTHQAAMMLVYKRTFNSDPPYIIAVNMTGQNCVDSNI